MFSMSSSDWFLLYEELGQGASVVKSKGEKDEREVWVLRVGEGEAGQSTFFLIPCCARLEA